MQGLVVDAAERRRNPVRKLSRLGTRPLISDCTKA